MGVIFDLNQTIIDAGIALNAVENGDWKTAYDLIPQMTPYTEVVDLIHELINSGTEVAVVTSSPRDYCEKVLNTLEITGVITVCYDDTPQHKPYPQPYLFAMKQMENQQREKIIAVGDEEYDLIAAYYAHIECALANWCNNDHYNNNYKNHTARPTLYCRDVECLVRYFHSKGENVGNGGLRQRSYHTYHLYDLYIGYKKRDTLSSMILNERRCNNIDSILLCDAFCREFEETVCKIINNPHDYGIFVVPSNTKEVWNRKLTDYVVPKLVERCGLIDCSKYIYRHTTKTDCDCIRTVQIDLSMINLQYNLPPQMKGAFIIDFVINTGKNIEACKQLLCNEGIDNSNIYCAVFGGSI